MATPDVVTSSRQPGLFGYVGEVSVPVVLEEPVGIFRGSLVERLDVRPVGEEDIELAVVVVIEDSHAAGHGFWRVTLGRLVAVELESQSAGRRSGSGCCQAA